MRLRNLNRIDIRDASVNSLNSRETIAFDCSLYYLGELVSTVQNEGCGGADMHLIADAELFDEMMAYAKSKGANLETELQRHFGQDPVDLWRGQVFGIMNVRAAGNLPNTISQVKRMFPEVGYRTIARLVEEWHRKSAA